jgi:hypothetical protein
MSFFDSVQRGAPTPWAKKEDVASLNVKKITDKEQDPDEEHVVDDGYDEVGVDGGDGEHELHGGDVGSCARSSCRTSRQTIFFPDFGNDNHSDSSYEVDSNDGEEDDLDDVTDNELDDFENDVDAKDDDDSDTIDLTNESKDEDERVQNIRRVVSNESNR